MLSAREKSLTIEGRNPGQCVFPDLVLCDDVPEVTNEESFLSLLKKKVKINKMKISTMIDMVIDKEYRTR